MINHWTPYFESRSWRDVLDTTLCDKFVSDLQQIGGFLRVLGFLHQKKTDRHDITEILLKVALHTITITSFLSSYSSK